MYEIKVKMIFIELGYLQSIIQLGKGVEKVSLCRDNMIPFLILKLVSF